MKKDIALVIIKRAIAEGKEAVAPKDRGAEASLAHVCTVEGLQALEDVLTASTDIVFVGPVTEKYLQRWASSVFGRAGYIILTRGEEALFDPKAWITGS